MSGRRWSKKEHRLVWDLRQRRMKWVEISRQMHEAGSILRKPTSIRHYCERSGIRVGHPIPPYGSTHKDFRPVPLLNNEQIRFQVLLRRVWTRETTKQILEMTI